MEMKKYDYPGLLKFFQQIITIMYVIVILAGGLGALVNSYNYFVETKLTLINLFLILLSIIVWIILLLILQFQINKTTPIIVSPKGLSVWIFTLWPRWIFIPWEEIVNVIEIPHFEWGFALVTFIQVEKLSLYHRLVGRKYTKKHVPGFLIYSYIDDYFELIEIIKSNSIEKAK